MRRTLTGASVAAMVLSSAAPAAANGRFPASNQIVFSPSNPDVIMTRTTFALLPSTDNGATWRYLCEGSLGLPSTTYEDPELGFTASGALVAGLPAPTVGLDVSDDLGCSWSCIGNALANQQIADTVVRPDSPHEVLALTSTFGIIDGGSYSQVFQSTDDGATWAALGTPIDSTILVTTIDVAANNPTRIYVSGTRGYGAARTAWLLVSTDTGQHWTEWPMPEFLGDQAGGETSIYIGAVDPTDADRVYIRSSGSIDGGVSRLYVTTDAGMSFTIAKDFDVEAAGPTTVLGELLGFAIAPDGSEIYVGTKENGLWRASKSDMSFSLVNATVGVQCLATRQTASGPELWACGNEYKGPPGNPGNFIVGRSTDDGVTFKALLPTLTSLSGIANCSSSTNMLFACETTAKRRDRVHLRRVLELLPDHRGRQRLHGLRDGAGGRSRRRRRAGRRRARRRGGPRRHGGSQELVVRMRHDRPRRRSRRPRGPRLLRRGARTPAETVRPGPVQLLIRSTRQRARNVPELDRRDCSRDVRPRPRATLLWPSARAGRSWRMSLP